MDSWALGCILFELISGVTPFHCTNEEKLIHKFNDGRYRVLKNRSLVYIETCLFLLECLQLQVEDRIEFDCLLRTPFLEEELSGSNLHRLDRASFYHELSVSEPKMEGGHTSQNSFSKSLVDCLDDF